MESIANFIVALHENVLVPLWLNLPGHEIVNKFLIHVVYEFYTWGGGTQIIAFLVGQVLGAWLLGWVVAYINPLSTEERPLISGQPEYIPNTDKGSRFAAVAMIAPHPLVALIFIPYFFILLLSGPKAWKHRLGKVMVTLSFVYLNFGALYCYTDKEFVKSVIHWLQKGL